jgi:hypothetical protein
MSALVVYRPRPEEAPVTIAVFCAEAETEKAALGAACVKRRKGGKGTRRSVSLAVDPHRRGRLRASRVDRHLPLRWCRGFRA